VALAAPGIRFACSGLRLLFHRQDVAWQAGRRLSLQTLGLMFMDSSNVLQLLERMKSANIADESNLIGCTDEETDSLEKKYDIELPHMYKAYLQAMGRRSGLLFRSDHIASDYSSVFSMTSDLKQEWENPTHSPPSRFTLPSNALVIAGRLGEQFEFIRCVDEGDTPVVYFNTWEWEVRESHPSILAWLESWCDEAIRAMESGYFNDNPHGTSR
jgi:SMI1 / KNR4 family (SUKH-1)